MRASRRLFVLVGVVGVIAVTAAAAFAAQVSWGKAVAAGGAVSSISCANAGNCAAGGNDSSGAFVQDETSGRWGAAIDLPDTPYGSVSSVSCPSAGNCTAGGYYTDVSIPGGSRAFLVDERNGVWGNPIDVPGATAATVGSVSCASPGNCAAIGWTAPADVYSEPQTFVVDETNGAWGQAAINLDGVEVRAISCVGIGNCVAAANYHPGAAFLTEKNGVWSTKVAKVPGPIAPQSLSCLSLTFCAAGGEGFVVSETRGVWRKPLVTPGYSGWAWSMSCVKPSYCVAAGSSKSGPKDDPYYGWLRMSKNGQWVSKKRLPVESFVNVVSCTGVGRCAAVGAYGVGADSRPFVMAEKDGVWGNPTNVRGVGALRSGGSPAYLSSISCVKTGRCALGGALSDTTGFVTAP